jgi:hypothetical protein
MNNTGSRAKRRHHLARVKAKCRKRSAFLAAVASANARHVGMLAATRAACSCWMCGNPRKYFGERTVQERRALQAERERLVQAE